MNDNLTTRLYQQYVPHKIDQLLLPYLLTPIKVIITKEESKHKEKQHKRGKVNLQKKKEAYNK